MKKLTEASALRPFFERSFLVHPESKNGEVYATETSRGMNGTYVHTTWE